MPDKMKALLCLFVSIVISILHLMFLYDIFIPTNEEKPRWFLAILCSLSLWLILFIVSVMNAVYSWNIINKWKTLLKLFSVLICIITFLKLLFVLFMYGVSTSA